MALGLVLTSGLLHALDPATLIGRYSHQAWGRDNGRLPAIVHAIAQTGDGDLWIGTDTGLLEFDGVRFKPYNEPRNGGLGRDAISALAPAIGGGLWIGTRQGLAHWKDGTVQNYRPNRPPAGVATVQVDSEGNVWAGTAGFNSGGLCRVEGNRLECLDAAHHSAILSLLRDRHGELWIGGLGLWRWKPDPPRDYLFDPGEMVGSIVEDHDGQIWMSGSVLRHVVNDKVVAYPLSTAGEKLRPRVLLPDHNGNLWIGTHGQGLYRLYKGRIDRFTEDDGLSGNVVYALFEDREGNLWVGTDGGLDRFREYAVTTLARREGLGEALGSLVFPARDGGIWLGTSSGLKRLAGIHLVSRDQRGGLPSSRIMGIFEEQNGRLWVNTPEGVAYPEGGRFRPLDSPIAQKISFAAALEEKDHSVWLSDLGQGLIRLRDARVAEVVPWSQFGGRKAWALESDPDNGGLWLGFDQGGIAWYKTGQSVRTYAIPGLPGNQPVMDLHRTRDGALWVASQGGLSRFHAGRFATLTSGKGLPCGEVRAMIEDEGGALWLSSVCGLIRFSPEDLADWTAHPSRQPRFRVLEASDGFRQGSAGVGYFRRAARSTDGRLWFALYDGVAMVDPRRLRENRFPPPVKIESIAAGDTTYSTSPGLKLPPLTRQLKIDYTALSYAAPEKVRFRYRLDGFDTGWHESSGRQAVYTNLPPSHYRFRVIACNNDGFWNETGAVSDFFISPAFYQTTWFRLVCMAAAVIVLLTIHWLRLRQMSAAMNAGFQERPAERTRIAREMHDSLLQNLCGVSLQLNGLAKSSSLPETTRHRLMEIGHDAEECLREAREFVWDLRAPTLQEMDLSRALREAGERIISDEPVHFQVTVNGEPRPAPTRLQQHLLRIVQEAMRNSVRYSRAKEIRMNIAFLTPGLIQVQMRDDGCGFDLEKVSREFGHWGLATMRERAEQIGAELKISSSPGCGTQIDILVPCAEA
jgi:ligand-binding sensor domain-containing protein